MDEDDYVWHRYCTICRELADAAPRILDLNNRLMDTLAEINAAVAEMRNAIKVMRDELGGE
jgi:hypothetical protein